MKLLILLAVLTTVTTTKATIIDEINNTLNNISDSVNYNQHQPETLKKTKLQLEQVLLDLTSGTGGNSPAGKLFCNSRDNDGRAPYVIASRDPRTMATVKYPNTTVSSMEDCTDIIKQSRTANGDNVLVCISRDNDSRGPWSLAILNQNSATTTKIMNYQNLTDCHLSVQRSNTSHYAMSICASRDNDGRAPYARFVFNFSSQILEKFETFNTLEECHQNNG